MKVFLEFNDNVLFFYDLGRVALRELKMSEVWGESGRWRRGDCR